LTYCALGESSSSPCKLTSREVGGEAVEGGTPVRKRKKKSGIKFDSQTSFLQFFVISWTGRGVVDVFQRQLKEQVKFQRREVGVNRSFKK